METGILIKSFFIFLVIRASESILCYQCDSLNYRTCAVQTCAGNRCQTRTSLMNNQVSHMCGVAMGTDGCRTTFGEKICICSSDKCNNEGINDSQNDNGGYRQNTYLPFVFCGLFTIARMI